MTLFLSRAEILQNSKTVEGSTEVAPTEQAITQWHSVRNTLFDRLSSDFGSLFPSARAAAALPLGTQHFLSDPTSATANSKTVRPGLDIEDEPVWQMFAAFAVSSDPERQQTLLASIRDKVLDNVTAERKKLVPEEIGAQKLVGSSIHLLFLDC